MIPATVIDARGHKCPVPTLRLRKAIEMATPGARLTLLATDPMARIDPLRDPAREIEFPGNAAVHLAFDAELGKTSTTEAAEHSVDKAGLILC